jgi:hypothetical protein
MLYGLKIRNIKEEIQIDGSSPHYLYREGGSESFTGLTTNDTFSLGTYTKKPPLVAIRPSNSFAFLLTTRNSTTGEYESFTVRGSGTFDYRVFCQPTAKGNSLYGLRIKNDRGEIVYDSSFSPFTISQVTVASVGTTYTHNQIENPFYLYSPSNTWIQPTAPVGGPGGLYYHDYYVAGIVRQSSTSFSLSWLQIATGVVHPARLLETGTTAKVIVCDVGETLSR